MASINIRRKIYDEIVELTAVWRRPPALTEIRRNCGGMTDDVNWHLELLEREGLICITNDVERRIVLLPTHRAVPSIEIQSSFPADRSRGLFPTAHGPITLDLHSMGVEINPGMRGFQVLDDSMIDAGVMCGDIAILVDNSGSDIVAVWIDGQLTLRRMVEIQGIPHFLAENSLRPELTLAVDVSNYGALWGVLRAGIAQRPRKRISYSAINATTPKRTASGYPEFAWPPSGDQPADERTYLTRRGSTVPNRKSQKRKPLIASGKKPAAKRTQLPPNPSRYGVNDGENGSYRAASENPE